MESKLDYLEDLGVGAVWMTRWWPTIWPRRPTTATRARTATRWTSDGHLGRLQTRRGSADREIRIVHDWVPNHWGNLHRLLTHPVDSAWVHNWAGGFTDEKRTNYRSGVVLDPHA